MSNPRILALDLASRSGFAVGRPGELPGSGSIRFARPGAELGVVFHSFREWLISVLAGQYHSPISLLVFESPIPPVHMIGKTNATTIRLLIGLCAIAEEVAQERGIDCREAKVSDVRAHFLGTNRIKRADAKEATIEACRRIGWFPKDDNEADSLALFHYQASFFRREMAVETSPLFNVAASSGAQ